MRSDLEYLADYLEPVGLLHGELYKPLSSTPSSSSCSSSMLVHDGDGCRALVAAWLGGSLSFWTYGRMPNMAMDMDRLVATTLVTYRAACRSYVAAAAIVDW